MLFRQPPTLTRGAGELLDSRARAYGKDRAPLAGAHVSVRHAAIEIDRVARPERERRIEIRVQLHGPAQYIEILFTGMADDAAQLLNASGLNVDDDWNHHFAEEIRSRIMVRVPLRLGFEFLARARDAAPPDRDESRRLLGRDDVLDIDVERLRQSNDLIVSERHLAILELRRRR